MSGEIEQTKPGELMAAGRELASRGAPWEASAARFTVALVAEYDRRFRVMAPDEAARQVKVWEVQIRELHQHARRHGVDDDSVASSLSRAVHMVYGSINLPRHPVGEVLARARELMRVGGGEAVRAANRRIAEYEGAKPMPVEKYPGNVGRVNCPGCGARAGEPCMRSGAAAVMPCGQRLRAGRSYNPHQ